MRILKGADASAAIKIQVAEGLERLKGKVPKLGIIRVGERADDKSYERGPSSGWRASA